MTVLKDALYNLDPQSSTDPDFARGVLVGVIAAVMEFDACTFTQAMMKVEPHLPKKVEKQATPDGWFTTLLADRM